MTQSSGATHVAIGASHVSAGMPFVWIRSTIRLGFVAALGTLAALLAPSAIAQSYPSRSVRIIVPYSPGTGPDILARTIGLKLAERWGQPFIIENRPGTGGIAGTDAVAKSQPNGYTILINVTPMAMGPALYKNLPYDPVTDLIPIAQVATGSNALVVNPKVMPVENFQQFVTEVRANPAKFNYASTGTGTPQYMGPELLRQQLGLDMLNVPYKSNAGMLADLLSGIVHLAYLPVSTALPFARSGQLRVLAVASKTRSILAPDAPSFAELGYPEADIELWFAFYGPAKMPAEVVQKWNQELPPILALPDVKEIMAKQGLVGLYRDSPATSAYLKSEIARWRSVVEKAGIQPE